MADKTIYRQLILSGSQYEKRTEKLGLICTRIIKPKLQLENSQIK